MDAGLVVSTIWSVSKTEIEHKVEINLKSSKIFDLIDISVVSDKGESVFNKTIEFENTTELAIFLSKGIYYVVVVDLNLLTTTKTRFILR